MKVNSNVKIRNGQIKGKTKYRNSTSKNRCISSLDKGACNR